MAERHVAVIGAGICGVASAVELLRDGHQVTILDPGPPGGEQAASYGNGTILSVGSVLPVSMPGLWRKVPGYVFDSTGPLTIQWAYLPLLLPWLLRFFKAGSTEAKVEATARALIPLVADSPERHKRLAEEAGVGHLIEQHGVLYPYPDRAAWEADAFAWSIRRKAGVTWTELDEDALRQQQPLLSRDYKFAILLHQGANVLDPGAYVAALARHAQSLGAQIVQASAIRFQIDKGVLEAVVTDEGALACDAAVIAAGIRSKELSEFVGDRVSLAPERGYHAELQDIDIDLRHPMLTSDTKVAVVRARGGLRVAGTVELAGLEAEPNWARARTLRQVMKRTIPSLPDNIPDDRFKLWIGNRPSTPDGVPIIGRSRACDDVIHAYGHGHIGLNAGAMTGRLVADLISGKPSSIDIAPFDPKRFRYPMPVAKNQGKTP